jgi:HK97 family phage prohead protease
MSLERAIVSFELKALTDTDGVGTFEGYGSVFNTVDSYNDVVAKGAYKQTLKEWKARKKHPKMLLQHGGGFFSMNADDLVPIGKWDEMVEDDKGLYMKGHLFDIDTDRAKAVYAALKEGELDGLSIGFRTKKFKMDEETGIRTLTEIQLFEVSLVTFPANDPARVTAVKADGVLPTEREFERWLRREAGFTEAHAKTIIAKGFRQVRREAMPSDSEACEELLALVNRRAAIPTGDQHGRTDAH